ncbi:MAG: hypothetical protein AAF639_42595, partial [Chloroflexota bacterium]
SYISCMIYIRLGVLRQTASAVGLISVDGQQPVDMLKGGRAIQQLWLRATQLGLSWHPMTSLLYMFKPILNPILTSTSLMPDYSPVERAFLADLSNRFDHLFPTHSHRNPLMLFRLSCGEQQDAQANQRRSLRRPVEEVLFYSG